MKILILLIGSIFLVACGLPEYTYISDPVIKERTDDLLSVVLSPEEYVNGYTLYGRYYYSQDSESALENNESSNPIGSSYLESLKFREVHILDSNFLITTPNIPSDRVISISRVSETTTTEQTVVLTLGDQTYQLGFDFNGSSYNNYHILGKFTDINNRDFVKNSINEEEPEDSYVRIEFAIIVKGVKIDPVPEPIYSDPLYLGSFRLQIER